MTSLVELREVSVESLAEEAARIQAEARKISDWIKEALEQVDTIGSAHNVVSQMKGWSQYADKLREGIQKCLYHEDPACKLAAWTALYHHFFSQDLRSGKEVTALLTSLVEREYLVADDEGPLKAYGRNYDFPDDSAMGEKGRAEARRRFVDLVARSWRQQNQRQEEMAQELLGQNEIAWSQWQQFLADEQGGHTCEGKYACRVPPVLTTTGRLLRGGVLLVEVSNSRIYPLQAAGGFATIVQEAKEDGTYLLTDALRWDGAPKIPNLPKETERQIRLLWRLLKQGIAAQGEREKTNSHRQALSDKATITSPAEFLVNKELGSFLVEYPGVWEMRTQEGVKGTIANVFFLAERKETENGPTIMILEAPPHLAEFLASCLDREFPEEGPRFGGLDQPLRAILKEAYGRAVRESRTND